MLVLSRKIGEEIRHRAGDIVRRAIPMLNRAAKTNRPEENRAERHDHRRILRLGIPLGTQSEAASFRAAFVRLLADSQVGDGPAIEFCNDLTTDAVRAELQAAVLAIVLELLHNARRHSKSSDILLGITRDDQCLYVQVEDWGVGFDVDREHSRGLGLKGIRHLVGWLGGTVNIDSQRGKGTCVMVEIPQLPETEPNGSQERRRGAQTAGERLAKSAEGRPFREIALPKKASASGQSRPSESTRRKPCCF